MANTSQQTLLAVFNQVAGAGNQAGPAPTDSSITTEQTLTNALGQATEVINSQVQATAANTTALGENSEAHTSSGAGHAVSDVLSTASDFLGGGLSAMPIVSLFTSLFGGGGGDQPAPLAPFSLPPSLSLESSTSDQGFVWGENGAPKSTPASGTASSTQITVQVQAMDSQSFLDHSDDIAQAVRKAMLNMNSLNDIVSNL